MYGVIDFSRIDTTPGAAFALAPPQGWKGNTEAYRKLMRERWQNDVGVKQHLVVISRIIAKGTEVTFVGPFAKQAKAIIESV